jgi:1-acyl-sn-glycerol-3-phosphate acyltransferase
MNTAITAPFRYRRRTRLLGLARRLGGPPLLLRLAGWFYRLRVEGMERLPLQGAVVFTFNHVSPVADGLAYLAVQRCRPRHLRYVSVEDQISGLFQRWAKNSMASSSLSVTETVC